MIEILTFRLADGASEAELVQADAAVQTGFAYQQSGLARRTTARGEGGEWLVVTVWASAAHADASRRAEEESPLLQRFWALTDPASRERRSYTPLD